MGKRKYPVEYRHEVDFESGGTRVREENKDERASRLKKTTSARRSRIMRKFRVQGEADFIDALSDALCLAIRHGQQYPLHFTIRFVYQEVGRADITSTERYTLENAATLHDLWTGEKTWSVWQKSMRTRKSDEGIELAFQVKEAVYRREVW